MENISSDLKDKYQKEKLMCLIKAADKDKDGYLSANELKECLKNFKMSFDSTSVNPNQTGDGEICCMKIKMKPNVGFTANKAENSGLSVNQFGPWKDPGGLFFTTGIIRLSSQGPFRGSCVPRAP